MRRVLIVLAVVALAAAGCGRHSESATGPALPDGWRWESFANVQVAVPGHWG